MPRYTNIVILTGAGISAESGIATFRDKDGIWSTVDFRDVATPEAFARNPQNVLDFYNTRRKSSAAAKPNPAHAALVRLEREHHNPAVKQSVVVVTQNVDSLHEAAGQKNLIRMHGQHNQVLCNDCGDRQPWGHNQPDLHPRLVCPNCNQQGCLRPDVVWFGEVPYHMDRIGEVLADADLFLSIGTSGNVYPAEGFVAEARRNGARTVELNLEPSDGVTRFNEAIHGQAGVIVPAYVERLLAGEA